MIDVRADDSRTRDESAPSAKVIADAVEQVAQPELFAVARKDSFPQRSVERHARGSVEAFRALERSAVDIAEHDAAIDIGDAIVIVAEHAVGVSHADSRLSAKVALGTYDVVERAIETGGRQAAVVRCRQQA